MKRWTLLPAALTLLVGTAGTAFAPPIYRPPVYRPPVPVYRPPVSVYRPSVIPHGQFTPVPRVVAPVRTAPMLHAEIHGVLSQRPAAALTRLHSAEARTLLGRAARLHLTLEATNTLASRVESGAFSPGVLAEARAARATADLPGEFRARLDQVVRTAERRTLTTALDEVRTVAEAGRWAEADRLAGRWQADLHAASTPSGGRAASPEFRARLRDVDAVLGDLRRAVQRLDALERIETTLQALDSNPADQATRLRQLHLADLPPPLRRQAEGMLGIAEVRELTSIRWGHGGPNVREVQATIARLDTSLAGVPEAPAGLGRKLQQELAVKAHLEGHAEAYFKLMPEDGPPAHAAALLRDLKAMALGEGKVGTEVARAALADLGTTPPTPRAPPGLDPLVPEGAREGWRPPVREKASADLPPLEQSAALSKTLAEKTLADIKPQRTAARKQAEAARGRIAHVHADVVRPMEDERRKLEAIEARVKRSLTTDERFRSREWLEAGRSVPDVAVGLELCGPEEEADDEREERFLERVEAAVQRPLTGLERQEVLRIRRKVATDEAKALSFVLLKLLAQGQRPGAP